MKYCILFASPRENGNTAHLLKPLIAELELQQAQCDLISLDDKHIEPCTACRSCQKDWTIFGCRHDDNVQVIFDKVLESDVIILATPIYSWYCTPPLKALLDRLVYGMNKYYGDAPGPSLWKGKKLAIIATCGYKPEKGADLFEEGMKRYCKHSELQYLGMLAERDLGYASAFMTPDKIAHSKAFAAQLMI